MNKKEYEWWCDMMPHPAKTFDHTLDDASPARRLSLTIDEVFDTCESSIHKKIIRLRLQTREEIHGPIGASRFKQYCGPDLVAPINKIFDTLEQNLLDELDKIKHARRDIIDSIKDSSDK